MPTDTVLEVSDLRTHFDTENGKVRAVQGVTFSMKRGKLLAIVGESGCGKSVTAYSILRLIEKPGRIVGGRVLLHPKGQSSIDVTALSKRAKKLYEVRGGLISMIFQEPMTALSPVHTIGNQICEAILLHQKVSKKEAEEAAVDMLRSVGIPSPETRLSMYPFEMSGGMRQRIVIAMALVCKPEILIADEPTTALDVTIQAQIMGLIRGLQRDMGISVLLITHDVGVVAQTADEVAVMYLGRIIEYGDVRQILKTPRHPYTMGLLESLPGLGRKGERLPAIAGSVPSLHDTPSGCPFHPRCPYMQPGRCSTGEPPPLKLLPGNRKVACIRAEEIAGGQNASA